MVHTPSQAVKTIKEILIKAPETDAKIGQQARIKALNELSQKNMVKPLMELDNLIAKIQRQVPEYKHQEFKSSHWDEPNVISHLRMNERTYKGKKVAFMEELQSDWAREGRDKGLFLVKS